MVIDLPTKGDPMTRNDGKEIQHYRYLLIPMVDPASPTELAGMNSLGDIFGTLPPRGRSA